ncbi:MAG: hypothetical protein ACRDTF_18545 [Pseudonocardiaceae bacterium]
MVGEFADGGASPVGGEVAEEPGEVPDDAGGVDLTGQSVHRAGGQDDGVVDVWRR